MRYLVKARVKPGKKQALLRAIEDGRLGRGSVADDEYLWDMQQARWLTTAPRISRQLQSRVDRDTERALRSPNSGTVSTRRVSEALGNNFELNGELRSHGSRT